MIKLIKKFKRKLFFRQKRVKVKVGLYELEAPHRHILMSLEGQPYRDHFVGISAKFYFEKYRDKSICDIGANIGDTAAMIASYCNARLILVEGSEFYYKYLESNIKLLPNKVKVINCFVGDGSEIEGELIHWGGTAFISQNENVLEGSTIKTVALGDLDEESPSLVKIDTDGHDYFIIFKNISYLAQAKCGILFEFDKSAGVGIEEYLELFNLLKAAGYNRYIIWDDAGFLILSTSDIGSLIYLCRYLYSTLTVPGARRIYNYDILFLHESDDDIFHSISAHYMGIGL